MSGITLILNRDGRPVARQRMNDALAALKHRGIDGEARWTRGNYALGQQNFLVSSADACGPVSLPVGDGLVSIAFDGRLDNRAHLITSLMPAPPKPPSDAELAARAYLRWGTAGLAQLRGSLALILADTRSNRVCLYRNPLGSRELYYQISPRHLLAATEPAAILCHPSVSNTIDEVWLTGYFSLFSIAGNRTVYRSIKQLLPGELLTWTADAIALNRATPDIGRNPVSYRDDASYAEHFRELLEQATARACDCNSPVGIMLSSGMDSGSAAYCARDHLLAHNQKPTAYSWSLRRFPDADESELIRALAAHAGIGLALVPADDCWPLSAPESWPLSINTPISNAFQRLKDRVYQAAAADRCRVLINAAVGDSLYPDPRYWLAEALADRCWRLFFSELLCHLGNLGLSGAYRDSALRQIVKQAIGWQPRISQPPPWLTSTGCRLYQAERTWPPEAQAFRHPDHYRALLGLFLSDASTSVNYFTNPLAIEVRDPYLDWDLVDFMLSIPSYRCSQQDQIKFIARNAMRGVMLEQIRTQGRVGLLSSFFNFGMFTRSRAFLTKLLMGADADWPKYVKKSWVRNALAQPVPDEMDGVLIWQCAAYEMWRRRFF